jgi:hypothetical protein
VGAPDRESVWVIKGGRLIDIDISALDPEVDTRKAKEYRLSELGRYLLNPNPIEIKKRLVGGEIYYRKGLLQRLTAPFRPTPKNGSGVAARRNPGDGDIIVSRFKLTIQRMKDPDLQGHLQMIAEELKAYDSFARRLAQLDPSRISHVIGICEDLGGNYSYLKLQGKTEEKINYLSNSITNQVGVVLNRAYLADGLFELRGFNFRTFRPDNSFRLLTYPKNGQLAACLLTPNGAVEFNVADSTLLKYAHLLEQCLHADPLFKETLCRCVRGEFRPVKLFFNNRLEIDYAKTNFPAVYREVFRQNQVDIRQRNLIKPVLNHLQTGISLSFQPAAATADERLVTHIAVLHDYRALDSLKKNLPAVYSEIGKRLSVSEAGRYYLLDSIKGYSNA